MFVARLLAGVPLVFVLAWAVSRLVSAAYLELTNPSDLAAPVVVRILRQAPGAPIAVVVAWLVTEVVVAFAVRRIVLSGASVLGGLGWAVGTAVRHPIDAAATLLATTAATVLLVVPAAAASALAWGGLRTALIDAADPLATAVLALAFTGLWLGAVALLGVAAAVESALWTAEARRRLTGPVAAPETRRDVPAVPTTTVRPA